MKPERFSLDVSTEDWLINNRDLKLVLCVNVGVVLSHNFSFIKAQRCFDVEWRFPHKHRISTFERLKWSDASWEERAHLHLLDRFWNTASQEEREDDDDDGDGDEDEGILKVGAFKCYLLVIKSCVCLRLQRPSEAELLQRAFLHFQH